MKPSRLVSGRSSTVICCDDRRHRQRGAEISLVGIRNDLVGHQPVAGQNIDRISAGRRIDRCGFRDRRARTVVKRGQHHLAAHTCYSGMAGVVGDIYLAGDSGVVRLHGHIRGEVRRRAGGMISPGLLYWLSGSRYSPTRSTSLERVYVRRGHAEAAIVDRCPAEHIPAIACDIRPALNIGHRQARRLVNDRAGDRAGRLLDQKVDRGRLAIVELPDLRGRH